MSMTKGTPASSQIVWLEDRVKELEQQRDALLIDLAASLGREDALKQQRDELLAALEEIRRTHYPAGVLAIADAAIAKVKP